MTDPRELKPSRILYIKLGTGGQWAAECLEKNMLKVSYKEVSHDDCRWGRWSNVEKQLEGIRTDKEAIRRDLNQIRAFYESGEDVMWVTFHGDHLWWCFSEPRIMSLPDGTRIRQTINSWKCTDIFGNSNLSKDNLVGALLSMEGYRGTICSVKESDYLLKKINGSTDPEIQQAMDCYKDLIEKMGVLIKRLHWKDFEDLIDLIFREGGWKRTGDRRKSQETIDLLLISPVTKEKISVQVKSKAGWQEYLEYKNRFSEIQDSSRFFFVVHSPEPKLNKEFQVKNQDEAVTFWGPKDIARLCVDYGMSEWVLQKAG